MQITFLSMLWRRWSDIQVSPRGLTVNQMLITIVGAEPTPTIVFVELFKKMSTSNLKNPIVIRQGVTQGLDSQL